MARAIPVAIALGSNLGDRRAHLQFARTELRRLLHDVVESTDIETDPQNVDPQPRFLNAAVVGVTFLAAQPLLAALHAIEHAQGRERLQPGAPRTLDLDLIFYGDSVIEESDLKVPHPRFRDRLFVLEPLAEIAASWRDPVTGLTVAALLDRLRRETMGSLR